MAGSKDALVKVEGQADLLRALSRMSKELNAEVRDSSQAIATRIAAAVPGKAATRLEVAVAANVKARRDRIPVVSMGTGSLSSGTPIRDVMYGAEFGGGANPRTQQFRPHRGRDGYFLYPTVRELGPQAAEDWFNAIADAVEAHWHN